MDLFLGLDPGRSGAVALVDQEGRYAGSVNFTQTMPDVTMWLLERVHDIRYGLIEKVASRTGQGVKSMFTFGRYYGRAEQLLCSSRIPHHAVLPADWEREMCCLTGGDKKVSKEAAQRLWPDAPITLKNADAILIAETARRRFSRRAGRGEGQ